MSWSKESSDFNHYNENMEFDIRLVYLTLHTLGYIIITSKLYAWYVINNTDIINHMTRLAQNYRVHLISKLGNKIPFIIYHISEVENLSQE